MWTKRRLLAALALCSLGLAGCDDPTLPREPFPDPALVVLLALNPDTTDHYMMLVPVAATGSIDSPRVEVRLDGDLVAVGRPEGEREWQFVPCSRTFGSDMVTNGGEKRCVHIPLELLPGETYEFVVRSPGHPTARAVTTVPGPFQITSVTAAGEPPGTESLNASWTSSVGADRYVVAVHADDHPRCLPVGCDDINGGGKNYGWQTATRDTVITTSVDAELVEGGEGAWHFQVLALDRALADFISTGAESSLFPVLPTGNVEGGVGVIGSWRSISTEIGQ